MYSSSSSQNGRSSLHLATRRNNLDIVQYLCQRGADLNLQDCVCYTSLNSLSQPLCVHKHTHTHTVDQGLPKSKHFSTSLPFSTFIHTQHTHTAHTHTHIQVLCQSLQCMHTCVCTHTNDHVSMSMESKDLISHHENKECTVCYPSVYTYSTFNILAHNHYCWTAYDHFSFLSLRMETRRCTMPAGKASCLSSTLSTQPGTISTSQTL